MAKKIKILAKLDKSYTIFGSNSHKYKLNPAISEEELEQFERDKGIVLPQEYRSFIVHIGNGGCGPNYGLLSIDQYNVHYDNFIWEDEDLQQSYLHMPFPHVDRWVPNSEWEEQERYVRNLESLRGTLALSHEGCGYYVLLITKGLEEGAIWLDGMCTDQGVMPLKNNDKRVGFCEWYENWLDKSIREVEESYKKRTIFNFFRK